MDIQDIPIDTIIEASWNSNSMTDEMLEKLRQSFSIFGQVHNLVVRSIGEGKLEVISGNQRLQILRERGDEYVACHVVELTDARARLLAMALNSISGSDNEGLKAEALRTVLESLSQDEVLSVLPETVSSLGELVSIGTQDLGEKLREWETAQSFKLKHFTAQLLGNQAEVVAEAIERIMPKAREDQGESPNLRGVALYLICKDYLEREGEDLP